MADTVKEVGRGGIQDQIIKALRKMGVWCRKNVVSKGGGGGGAFRYTGFGPGSPDLLVVLADGRALWIECKRSAKHKRSETQEKWDQKNRKENGAPVFVAWEPGQAMQIVQQYRAGTL